MVSQLVRSTAWRIAGCVVVVLATVNCGGESGSAPPPTSMLASMAAQSPAPTPTPVPSPTPVPTMAAMSGVVVQAGDSIGSGLGAGDWAAIDHLGFAPAVAIHNVSTPGKAMEAGYGNREAELFVFRATTAAPSVLLIQQGSNDLYYGKDARAIYQAILTPFVSAARKAGFYVVVDTVLPRADGGWTAAMEQQRVAYNTSVRGNAAGADAVNDLAADVVLGDAVNPATSPYYADAVHPNLTGQQRLAMLDAAVLGPFLYRYARAPSR